MCRITQQQNAAVAKALGHPGVEGVNGLANHIADVEPSVGLEKFGQKRVIQHLLPGFSVQHHELIAPPSARSRHADGRARRAAHELGEVGTVGIVEHIEDDPVLLVGAAGHGNTKPFANGAAPTVAGQHPVCPDLMRCAGGVADQHNGMIALLPDIQNVRREPQGTGGLLFQAIA